jgi:hypothetical protein
MRESLFFLGAVLAGCSSAPPPAEAAEVRTVRLSPELSDPWLADGFARAVERWDAALGGTVRLETGPGGIPVALTDDAPGGATGLEAWYFGGAIGVRPRLTEHSATYVCTVLMHEIGHVLGVPHLATGIMRQEGEILCCVDAAAAAQVPGAKGTCER